MMDRENQARSERLASKMGRLKDIAIDIQMDAIDQNRHLDGMGSEFDSTQGLLGGSVNRIGKMISSGKGNRKLICYMVLLAVIMFFVLYFLVKWTGGSKSSS